MVNPVGFRFSPTDEEIVNHYLRFKNLGGSETRHVDQVISTVNMCNFDPWELRSESRMESEDQVWYFFRLKQNGPRQMRRTKSGSWKKTGDSLEIKRARGHPAVKIGTKSILVFYLRGFETGTDWIMHEYEATPSPNQNMTYTICKVFIKRREREVSSPRTEVAAHSDSQPTQMVNESITGSEELQGSSDFLDKQQEPELEEPQGDFNSASSSDWTSVFSDAVSTQYSLTGILSSS